MKKDFNCIVCGEPVEKVSHALCRKLFDKNTKKIMCLSCLANELEVETSDLIEKAKEFKEAGCTLFK